MRSSFWDTLGLPPGSARAEIRRAYARKLREANPEDDPEGFKALREAYEIALLHADSAGWSPPNEMDEAPDEERAEEVEHAFAGGHFAPDPAWAPAAPAEPELAADADSARLDELVERFRALLDAPESRDVDALEATLDEVAALLPLVGIGAAERAERAIAWSIAQSIPRSDCVIERAARQFGWGSDETAARRDWAIDEILWRMREWEYIDWAAHPESQLRHGWRSLTEAPAPEWRMRLEARSTARMNQVESILAATAGDMPGIRHHLVPERAQWWDRHLSKARMTLDTLLLAPLLAALSLAVLLARPSTAAATPLFGLALLAACASPFLYLRFVKQRQHEWLRRLRPAPPLVLLRGWMVAAAALPIAAAFLPRGDGGAAGAAALSAFVVLWTAVAVPPRFTTAGFAARIWEEAPRSWHIAVFAMITVGMLEPHYHLHAASVAAALGFVWWRGRGELVYAIEAHGPQHRTALAVCVVAMILGVAAAAKATLPLSAHQEIYAGAVAAALSIPILALAWSLSDPESNRFPLVLCWVFMLAVWAGPQEPDRSRRVEQPPVTTSAEPPPPQQPEERSLDCTSQNADPVNCIWPGSDPDAEPVSEGRAATKEELDFLDRLRRGEPVPRSEVPASLLREMQRRDPPPPPPAPEIRTGG